MKPPKSKENSLFHTAYTLPYDDFSRVKLYRCSKGNADLIQRMKLIKKLPIHTGCVNTICWNESGEYLLSGSDDQHLIITHGFSHKVVEDYKTTHRANIFSAKFLPCIRDSRIVSCSGDGIVLFTDLMSKSDPIYNQFNCHSGTTYEVATVPLDPNSFLSCGEDGTVRWYDLRIKEKCSKTNCQEDIMISCLRAVTALSVNATAPYQLAIGCSDSTVRLFDRRMLGTNASGMNHKTAQPIGYFTVPTFNGRECRITSLCFSPDGEEILVNYSSDHLYLFSIKDREKLELKTAAGSKKPKTSSKGEKSAMNPVRRLRLRGDWSDTGPDARSERECRHVGVIAQARPTLHATLMQRMTDVLARMLNDPATRAALSGGGEDSLEGVESAQTVQPPQQPASPPPQDPVPGPSNIQNSPTRAKKLRLMPGQSSRSPDESSRSPEPAAESSVPSCSRESSEPTFPKTETTSEYENSTDVMEADPSSSSITASEKSPVNDVATTSDARSTNPEVTRNLDSSFNSLVGDYNTRAGLIQRDLNNLQSQLTDMRDGFIERHGVEPGVRLSHSDQGSTTSSISMGVGSEALHRNPKPASQPLKEPSQFEGSAAGSSDSENEENARPSDLQLNPSSSRFETDDTSPDYDLNHESADGEFGSTDYLSAPDSLLEDGYDSDDDELDHRLSPVEDASNMCDENTYGDCSSQPAIRQKYIGHRNARTMIKEATFWGSDYVMSGSDCGHIFIWERVGGKLVMLLEADAHVVNCLQPHPTQPLLASSGIDHDVKFWAPTAEEPAFDQRQADVLMMRNAVMLEETKDTITVPASFMIRMLACLNQIRRGGGRSRMRRRQGDQQED